MFILAYITDFFFQAKVSETARQLNIPIRMVKDTPSFRKGLEEKPSLIIVDLAAKGVDAVELTREAVLEAAGSQVVAFGAHVKAGVLERAAKTGAKVTSRSRFSKELPDLLAIGHRNEATWKTESSE